MVVLLKANETWPTLTISVGIAVLGMQKEKLHLKATYEKGEKPNDRHNYPCTCLVIAYIFPLRGLI